MPILAGPIVRAELVQEVVWSPLEITWTGPDGTVFDLTDPDSGIVLSPDGNRGFSMPPFQRYTSTAPGIAGSRYRGTRTLERPVFLPVFVYAGSSVEFIARDRLFWQSMRPDQIGALTVTQPTGETRTLACRYTDDGGQSYGIDPVQAGWSVYGVYMVAEQPYWTGDKIVRAFAPPDNQGFFSSSGSVFTISPSGTTDSAFIPNPGDVDAWPIWTVTDVAGATLGAGGGSVVVPAVAAGTTVTIDTRPEFQTAFDNTGTDVSASITWNPLPVPPGEEVQLSISLTSPGTTASVTCSYEPLFYRAW